MVSHFLSILLENPSITSQLFHQHLQQEESDDYKSVQRAALGRSLGRSGPTGGTKRNLTKSKLKFQRHADDEEEEEEDGNFGELAGFEDETRAEGSLTATPLESGGAGSRAVSAMDRNFSLVKPNGSGAVGGAGGGAVTGGVGGSGNGEISSSTPSGLRHTSLHTYGTFGSLLGRKLLQSRAVVQPGITDLFGKTFRLFLLLTISLTVLSALLLPIETLSPSLSHGLDRTADTLIVGCVSLPHGMAHPTKKSSSSSSTTRQRIHALSKQTKWLVKAQRKQKGDIILVWPDALLALERQGERELVLQAVETSTREFGIWIQVGMTYPVGSDAPIHTTNTTTTTITSSRSRKRARTHRQTELLLIGPRGLLGTYVKPTLVAPLVESWGTDYRPPLWTIHAPPGSSHSGKKSSCEDMPGIGVVPAMLLDVLRPSVTQNPRPPQMDSVTAPSDLLNSSASTPFLYLVSSSPPPHLASTSSLIFAHASDLAIQHAAHVVVCDATDIATATSSSSLSSSSNRHSAVSGLLDTDGSTRFVQHGQAGWAIPISSRWNHHHHDRHDENDSTCNREQTQGRRLTGWEYLGPFGSWSILTLIMVIGSLVEGIQAWWSHRDHIRGQGSRGAGRGVHVVTRVKEAWKRFVRRVKQVIVEVWSWVRMESGRNDAP